MAFLQDQTVIHIKLTDKGRELLSRGELTFKKFAVGDSEIDYGFNSNNGLDPSKAIILRPFDNNPEIVSFITEEVSGDTYTDLPSIANTTTSVSNTVPQKGMFNVTGSTTVQYSDTAHVKQPNTKINISGLTGGTTLEIKQSATYVAGSAEPVAGDYVMVKWFNPYTPSASTVNFNVNIAVPYLFYKIESIDSGTLAADNLIVTVDRNLPNYSGSTSSLSAMAVIYPNNNSRKVSGDSIQNYYGSPFITDFVSEAMIAFIENYDTPTIDVPVWNMTIVFTEDVAGIDPSTNRTISGNPSVEYGGIVQYIQKISPTVKNVGLIHYTNQSPSNNYGEGFVATPSTVPTLNLPTIMWHQNTGGTIGIELSADYDTIDSFPELDTTYLDLVDGFGNVVGKVFPDMKLFVIEDQELLFAMSYKSNRSWTLPPLSIGFNATLCPTSDVEITEVEVIV